MFRFVLSIAVLAQGALAIGGPFVFWGIEPLQQVHIGAIQRINGESLQRLYSEAEAIVIFVRNASSTRLKAETYPSFTSLLTHNPWTYLAQDSLSADPADFNTYTEVGGHIDNDLQIE